MVLGVDKNMQIFFTVISSSYIETKKKTKKGFMHLIVLLILFVALSARESPKSSGQWQGMSQQTYIDIEAYRKAIVGTGVGIMRERGIDLNDDGRMDYLIYLSGGEEYYLNALISSGRQLVRLHITPSDDYEAIISPEGRHVLRIGHNVAPGMENSEADCRLFQRYEYIEFRGDSLVYANDRYPLFYEKMITIYKTRINELKAKLAADSDPQRDFWESRVDFQIAKYREFIEDAEEIIKVSSRNRSEPNCISEDYRDLIREYFPDRALLELADLNPSARAYFETHVVSPRPSLLYKDIDENDLLDFILLLKDKQSGAGKLIFVIFMQTKRGIYENRYQLELEAPSQDMFLIPLSPGYMLGQGVGKLAIGLCSLSDPTVSTFSFDSKSGKFMKSSVERFWILCQ